MCGAGITGLKNEISVAMFAVVWMLGALASFCLMAVGARELSGELPVFQSLFFRSVIGLLAISLVVLFSRRRQRLSTQRLGLHTLRNVFHLAVSTVGFSALAYCHWPRCLRWSSPCQCGRC